MRKIKIQNIENGLVNGIEVQMPESAETCREAYFEWTATSLVGKMKTNEISGGVLRSWKHTPVFYEMESHVDTEMFYFVSGTALMLFIDMKDGKPDIETAQIVRIFPGTGLAISPGKGHFVAVAEGAEPVCAVVAAPRMEAPRQTLQEAVEGY